MPTSLDWLWPPATSSLSAISATGSQTQFAAYNVKGGWLAVGGWLLAAALSKQVCWLAAGALAGWLAGWLAGFLLAVAAWRSPTPGIPGAKAAEEQWGGAHAHGQPSAPLV